MPDGRRGASGVSDVSDAAYKATRAAIIRQRLAPTFSLARILA
jgi:hypothetical protein